MEPSLSISGCAQHNIKHNKSKYSNGRRAEIKKLIFHKLKPSKFMLCLHKQKQEAKRQRLKKTRNNSIHWLQKMQTHGAMDGRGQNALVTGGQTFCCRKLENRGVESGKGQQPSNQQPGARSYSQALESTLQLTAGIPFNKKIQLCCFYCCCCCCVFISSDTMQKASDCQDLRINNE